MGTLKIFVVDYIGIPLIKAFTLVREQIQSFAGLVALPVSKFISKANATLAPPVILNKLIRLVKKGGN